MRAILSGLVLVLLFDIGLFAQGGGLRAGTKGDRDAFGLRQARYDDLIEVEGRVERRVVPDAVRLVLAITTQAETPAACQQASAKRQKAFREALRRIGVPADKVTFDFIALVPVYGWAIEKQSEREVAVEKPKSGILHVNAHIEVPDDSRAMQVIEEAFKLNISDIIAFDYWSNDLDKHKDEARREAVQTAKKKADQLFGVLFEKKPRPVNVIEQTHVIYPKSLYREAEKVYRQEFKSGRYLVIKKEIPRIEAIRPKNTYYEGFSMDTDRQNGRLAMRPEISVVSRVVFYYRPPRDPEDTSARAYGAGVPRSGLVVLDSDKVTITLEKDSQRKKRKGKQDGK